MNPGLSLYVTGVPVYGTEQPSATRCLGQCCLLVPTLLGSRCLLHTACLVLSARTLVVTVLVSTGSTFPWVLTTTYSVTLRLCLVSIVYVAGWLVLS